MSTKQKLTIERAIYATIGKEEIIQYRLKNANGLQVNIINYGATITHLFAPDRNGKLDDIVLGFDTIEEYVKPHPFFGATIGRYGNRIANAQFTIADQTYHLAKNAGKHHLHGGKSGFDKKVWQAETIEEKELVGVKLQYLSPHLEENYPGNLSVTVTYTLNNENELAIHYEAKTDQLTHLNLTNHSYFNLKGENKGTILEHQLQIDAAHITSTDADQIPTGQLASVENTPFDFTKATPIGKRIDADYQQLKYGKGYDHNFVFKPSQETLPLRAKVYEASTGRMMKMSTTEPAVQLYTLNIGEDEIKGKNGFAYKARAAFCLETQHFPDTPNQANFPSTLLAPDEVYQSTTIYQLLHD